MFRSIKKNLKSVYRRFRPAGNLHPWYRGFTSEEISLPKTITPVPIMEGGPAANLSRPILFLARGHSGTRALAEILKQAGVYIGSTEDRHSLNNQNDSLYWAYGFQRTLIPRLFKWGDGCMIDPRFVTRIGLECLNRHLRDYTGGHWGFKTCAGMFCHPLYRFLFPDARYIYMIRDGRDVTLSSEGRFHLTQSSPAHPFWEYFKIITFGISNDMHACPFPFPIHANEMMPLQQNKYWIQAKSWKEHVAMMERLKTDGGLSTQMMEIRYEALCHDPVPVLEKLFDFLEIELTQTVKDFSTKILHIKAVGRWKDYKQYISHSDEDMEAIFDFMAPELELLGYD